MSGRTPLIAGNWKMHHGVAATTRFLEELATKELPRSVDVLLCPPYVALPAAAMVTTGTRIGIGAQNVHWEEQGAFTGEVSAPMLSELGIGWAIAGHSERRQLFGESDDTAVERATAAQAAGLDVILCIGESLDDRDGGRTLDVLRRQTRRLGELDGDRLVLAYEPVWAIGTGRTATPEQAQEAHAFLRDRLTETFGAAASAAIRILYGGSLKPGNAADLVGQHDVDGGLIGGASLDVDSFFAIIRAAAACAAGE